MNNRNEVITKLNEQGLSYGQIAKAFGITRQRICQIVNKSKKNLTKAGK
ncbi:MAG: helix-turn-helix domain-containing protein [Dehalococcoidia bacterium]|nr:helix-turn-helix domain-containing protein [Dehalococcoidia bacterium]